MLLSQVSWSFSLDVFVPNRLLIFFSRQSPTGQATPFDIRLRSVVIGIIRHVRSLTSKIRAALQANKDWQRLRSIEGPIGATRDRYSNAITGRTAPFCDRGVDLASERFDHSCADSRRLRVGVQRRAVALIGDTD
jgi:hypothetical protein